MSGTKDLKIALVHDFLVEFGGAERVLRALCEMFPEAPIYTLLAEKENFPAWLKDKKIETSFLQKWPKFLRKRKKWLLPFLPVAPETFNLREYDLVISSSGAWSKGIVTRLDTIHISYLHSPMRFAWDMNCEYLRGQKKGRAINFFTRSILNYIRLWDFAAADRPEYLIANSQYTKDRIKKYYNREASVIYPPVAGPIRNYETNPNLRTIQNQNAKYFLVVSRLSPYKKIDVIIEAFNKLELPLMIVGTGDQKKYLKSIAGKNIKFLGFQSEEKLARVYAGARCFVFSALDDFGIAPVEAMLCGVPVLGIRAGGMKEIILEGKTGEFFDAATPEVISDGVRRFRENENSYDKEIIKARAGEFSEERFKREMGEFIESKMNNFQFKI
ncbi:MAG: glycosyltransferase [Candidatus Moranbacteria bacterium]|nr:glycosyltransferase [Candidatus Moranbacteria bacterium]